MLATMAKKEFSQQFVHIKAIYKIILDCAKYLYLLINFKEKDSTEWHQNFYQCTFDFLWRSIHISMDPDPFIERLKSSLMDHAVN